MEEISRIAGRPRASNQPPLRAAHCRLTGRRTRWPSWSCRTPRNCRTSSRPGLGLPGRRHRRRFLRRRFLRRRLLTSADRPGRLTEGLPDVTGSEVGPARPVMTRHGLTENRPAVSVPIIRTSSMGPASIFDDGNCRRPVRCVASQWLHKLATRANLPLMLARAPLPGSFGRPRAAGTTGSRCSCH